MKRQYIKLQEALRQAKERNPNLPENSGICACYEIENMGFAEMEKLVGIILNQSTEFHLTHLNSNQTNKGEIKMSESTSRIMKIITDPRLSEKRGLTVALEFLMAIRNLDEISYNEYILMLETFEKVLNNEI